MAENAANASHSNDNYKKSILDISHSDLTTRTMFKGDNENEYFSDPELTSSSSQPIDQPSYDPVISTQIKLFKLRQMNERKAAELSATHSARYTKHSKKVKRKRQKRKNLDRMHRTCIQRASLPILSMNLSTIYIYVFILSSSALFFSAILRPEICDV